MQEQPRQGISMIELIVAVAVMMLAVGPLITFLSYSNRASNCSVNEEFAVQFAREILDQLLKMDAKFPDILDDLAGNTNLSDLLTDTQFIKKIEDASIRDPRFITFGSNGVMSKARLFLSPLAKGFSRKIQITKVSNNSMDILKGGIIWKVVVTIGWRNKGATKNTLREIKMGIFLNEK